MKFTFFSPNAERREPHLYMKSQQEWDNSDPSCWYFFSSDIWTILSQMPFSCNRDPVLRGAIQTIFSESIYYSLGRKFYCCFVRFDKKQYNLQKGAIRELLEKTLDKKINMSEAKEFLFSHMVGEEKPPHKEWLLTKEDIQEKR